MGLQELDMKRLGRKYFVYGFVLVVLSYAFCLAIGREAARRIVEEGGIIESVGAIAWLVAAITMFRLYYTSGAALGAARRNVFVLFLGVFCFVCFGEEISWGQRLLGLGTTETLSQVNRQGDLTLHNLYFLSDKDREGAYLSFVRKPWTPTRLFQMFWCLYCVVLPMLSHLRAGVARWLKRAKVPLPPLGFVLVFFLNYVLSRMVGVAGARWGVAETPAVVEFKESNWGILFMLIGFYFWESTKSSRLDQQPKKEASLAAGG